MQASLVPNDDLFRHMQFSDRKRPGDQIKFDNIRSPQSLLDAKQTEYQRRMINE